MFDPQQSSRFLRGLGFGSPQPEWAVVLGTGFAAIEDELQLRARVAYRDVPGLPTPAGTAGHRCRLSQGTLAGTEVLLFCGRYHAYEGFAPRELAALPWTAHALGARKLLLTNAAGGLRGGLVAGSLLALEDHLNLTGINPLAGRERLEGAVPFPAMAGAYDTELRARLLAAGKRCGEAIESGVYAALAGPSFETAAEVRMLRALGADAVGMSTVPEALTARALGMRICALSLITNVAGGAADSHEHTLRAGADNAPRLARLLREFLAG